MNSNTAIYLELVKVFGVVIAISYLSKITSHLSKIYNKMTTFPDIETSLTNLTSSITDLGTAITTSQAGSITPSQADSIAAGINSATDAIIALKATLIPTT